MEKLTLANWKQLLPYVKAANYNEYNSNIMTMLMWSNMYETFFECHSHYALIYSTTLQGEGVWLLPQCEKQYRREAIERIRTLSKIKQLPFEIHSMTKDFKDWLQQNYPDEFLVWSCINAQDYVYDRYQQQTLAGKKMQKRRNHFHAFMKQYENRWYYKPIEQQDLPNIYAFLKQWQSEKEESETIKAEEYGIRLLLEHMHELAVLGGCIYIDGKLEAFTIASHLSDDTIQIHVEKANHTIRGLYIAILKCFLETLEEDIRFINREDDMGKASLRKAKRDMHPIKMVQKFGSIHQKLEIKQASKKWLSQIQALWLERFPEESETTTAYYFKHFYREEDCFLLTCHDELIAMLQLRNMNIMIDQQALEVPFVVGVATNKEYEGCGYMQRLLNEAIQIAKKKGYLYMLLQAYHWDIYKPFGFYEAYLDVETKLDKSYYLTALGTLRQPQNTYELLHIYQVHTKDKQGYRIRSEKDFESMLTYDKLWQRTWLVHKDHEVDGYVRYFEDEKNLYVEECCYLNKSACDAMLSLLCQKDKKIVVTSDPETMLAGKRKYKTSMMVKELSNIPFPTSSLFIHEEL